MSGIEVAGIVLAVLPLIITAVQNYSDCVEEYSHYKATLHGFRVRLSLEQTIFQDNIERLILPELSEAERALYFSAVGRAVATAGFWNSTELIISSTRDWERDTKYSWRQSRRCARHWNN